jgi:uncharacterized protein YqgC (DUF456 family)
MEWMYWLIIWLVFIIGFVGLIYPIIPSVLFIVGGMLLYGVFFSFEPFSWFFWIIQGMFVLLLFGADYLVNLFGVKKFGGSKAGVWGSTIGLLIGPFVIPFLGIILGPFLGAVIAELLVHKQSLKNAVKIGMGSVVGFVGSVITKFIIQTIMIVYFFIRVL